MDQKSNIEIDNDLVVDVTGFATVKPKFTMAKWESGEGANTDAGEAPADK